MSVGMLDASMDLVWETCHMYAKHRTTHLQKQFPFATFTSNKLGRINQLLKRRTRTWGEAGVWPQTQAEG